MIELIPSPEQIKALREFAGRNGRTWKAKLRDLWMTGNYDYDADDSASLQQIRNIFGPSWLTRFKLPHTPRDLEDLALTNGEDAMVTSIAHFLSFMRRESAPVPANEDEFQALLTHYVIEDRRERMEYVSRLRVERGEKPLPVKAHK